jgi:hypothetical protein
MTYFLDDKGNIPTEMPKKVRELASFMALVVDTTTKTLPSTLASTEIRCFEKGCHGMIKSEIISKNNDAHRICSKCPNEGVISKLQKMKWDIRVFRK